MTVKLDLQDVDVSDIDTIVLTKADGTTQAISVADAIAGIEVSIPAGTAATNMPSIAITPADDDIYEQLETLGMNLSSPVNAMIGTDTATGDILDESDATDPLDGSNTDGDKPTVSIAATDDTAIEGVDSVLKYVVSQDNVSNVATTINVKVDLTNTDVDALDIESISYTNAAGQIVTITGQAAIQATLDGDNTLEVKVPADSTAAPEITVIIKDDAVYEADERLSFVIDSADTANIDTTPAQGTILDTSNEGDKPTVTVSDAEIDEGGDLEHTVTLSNPTQTEVTYDFDLSGVTATEGEDFDGDAATDVVFSGGVTYDAATGTITVPVGVTEFTVSYPTLDDNIADDGETTTVTVDGKTGTGTINDEDGTDPTNPVEGVTVSIVDSVDTVNEGDTGSFLVELRDANGDLINAITDITVEVTYSGVAANGDDFTGSSTVIIPAGSSSAPLDLVTIEDQLSEGDEIVNITISNPQGGGFEAIEVDANANTADMTIVDGDKSVVDIEATKDTAIEGVDNTLIFTVSQQTKSESDTTVDIKLGATSTIEAEDIVSIVYTNASGVEVTLSTQAQIQAFFETGSQVTIPTGSTTAPTIKVTVADDAIYEKSEDMVLEISNPVSAGNGIVEIGKESDMGTILDEDRVPGTGDQLGDFNDGDETEVTDQGQPVDGNLLGNASETDADITLNVSNVQVDTTGDGTPDTVITIGTPTAITDVNGNPVGSLTVNPDGSYTFTPDGDFTGDVPEISYDVVDAGSGDVLDSSKLDITVNATPVEVSLGVTKGVAIETTENSDTLEFAVTQAFKSDKDTTVKVQLDKVGSAGITASDIASITYTDATGEVTLTDPSAIESFLTSGVDIVIAAGSKEVPVVFEIADDSVYEGQETLTLNIIDARNDNGASIGDNAQLGTISDESNNPDNPLDGSNTDGDKPTVSIAATDNTAIEGVDSVLTYLVSQDNISNVDTTINVKVDLTNTDVDASDIESISYTNAAGKIVTVTGSGTIQAILDGDTTLEVKVPAGSTAAPEITVIIKDDVIYEAQESLSFVIDSADHAVVNTKEATGTILDTPNDGDKPTVTVSGASAVEGDTLVHTVTLSHTTQTEVSYPFELKDGSAKAGEDYSNTPTFTYGVTYDAETGTITVPAGVTEFTVSYPTINDSVLENNETTQLEVGGTTGIGTILDNDIEPTIIVKDEDGVITPADNSVIEGSRATVTGTIKVTNPQSVSELTIGGESVLKASTTPVTIDGNQGKLVITGYNSSTGELTYKFTENGKAKDHSAGDNSVLDKFDIMLTTTAGTTVADALDIQIIDTQPVAKPDTNAVKEDTADAAMFEDNNAETSVITGNVLTNDIKGADSVLVSSVNGDTGAVNNVIEGKYGEITINDNGTYTYTLDNTNSKVQELGIGDTLKESFNYTITDADGDSSTSKLEVTVEGSNDRPIIINIDKGEGVIDTINITEQEDGSSILKKGIVAFDDVDVSDVLTLSYLNNASTTISTSEHLVLSIEQEQAFKDMFELSEVATNSQAEWNFVAPSGLLDLIPHGETVTIRYAVQVDDGEGITNAQNGDEISKSEIRYVEVVITGTNDNFVLVDDIKTILEDKTLKGNIFDNDTQDPDYAETLQVESFTIGDSASEITDLDVIHNIEVNGQVIGTIKIQSNGDYHFEPEGNYSGQVPDINVNVSNGEDAITSNYGTEKLSITVTPVSDKPGPASASVKTNEDTTVNIGVQVKGDGTGLKAPTITDSTDRNGTANGDNPERIGLITLSNIPKGTKLDFGGVEYPATGPAAKQTITILLSDYLENDMIVNNPSTPTLTMTQDQFESLKLTPPKDDATNISINTSVTEFEVDADGNKLSGVNGATTTGKINVDVQAVTDSANKNNANDDASQFGYEAGEGIDLANKTYTVTTEEGQSFELPITTTFGDLVGTDNSRETYGFVLNNLRPGATVEFTPAGGGETQLFIVDNTGTVLIGVTKDGSGNITGTSLKVNSSSQPQISIKPGDYDSVDMKGVTVSLYTQDHDPDSTTKHTSVERIDTVKVDLTVMPVAGQVDLINQGISIEEDNSLSLSQFGFKVLDDQQGNDDLAEKITQIVFKLPSGWSYKGTGEQTADGKVTIEIPKDAQLNVTKFLEEQFIKPPAHSSKDADFTFEVTTVDKDDNGSDSVATVTKILTQKVEVTPVAEEIGADDIPIDSDDGGVADLTMTLGFEFRVDDNLVASEDNPFNIGENKDFNFNLKDNWSNQDDKKDFGQASHTSDMTDSEETFALLTFGNKVDATGVFTSITGATFTYTDASGNSHSLVDTGEGVEIPVAYLDTVTGIAPQDYSEFNVADGSKSAVRVQAKTYDYDEDDGTMVEAISGEAYLTFKVIGVADATSLGVDPAVGYEDQAIIDGNQRLSSSGDPKFTPKDGIELHIRPSSRDTDGSETFDVTISDIPEGVQLYLNGKGDPLEIVEGSVTIEDYTNAVENLYLITPENYSGTITLQVQAVSKEDGTTGEASKVIPLPVKVIGQADLIENDNLRSEKVTLSDNQQVDFNHVLEELVNDNNGNKIALAAIFENPNNIRAYDVDKADGFDTSPSEQVIYSVTGLAPEFDLTGKGVTFLGGTGADRTWSVTLEAITQETAQISTPTNFAGSINFTMTGTTTEKVSGNSVTHEQRNVSILVKPDADDSVINDMAVTGTEDIWTTIDFGAAFTTTDQGDVLTGTESLKNISIQDNDLIAKGLILKVNGVESSLIEDGTHIFNADDKVEIKHQVEHLDTPVDFDIEYTYTNKATINEGSTFIEAEKSGTATVSVGFQAVTDTPSMSFNEIPTNISQTEGADVTVNISSPDQDGSELFTRLEISDVPEGVMVVDGVLSEGVWYVDVPDTAITSTAATFNLKLQVDTAVDKYKDGDYTIKIKGFTQDLEGSGISGKEAAVTEELNITLEGGGSEAPAPAQLVEKLEDPTNSLIEDQYFFLSDTLTVVVSNEATEYSFKFNSLPEGSKLDFADSSSSINSFVTIQEIEGSYIVSVKDAKQVSAQAVLESIKVTPPTDFSTNELNAGQDFSYEVVLTAKNAEGAQYVQQLNSNTPVKPITDELEGNNGTTSYKVNEDTPVEISVNLTNQADGQYVKLVDGKLYLSIDEGQMKSGQLLYNGQEIVQQSFATSPIDGAPAGSYYVIDLTSEDVSANLEGVNPPNEVTVTYQPADNEDGNVRLQVFTANQEVHDLGEHDSGVQPFKHTYEIEVLPKPDNQVITNPEQGGDVQVVAQGKEDEVIAVNYMVSNLDDGDLTSAIIFDNVPDGYLVYYKDQQGVLQLANNNGNSNGGDKKSWSVDADELQNGVINEPGRESNIFIKGPENYSGKLEGEDSIVMQVINDSGMKSDPYSVELEIAPVADTVTMHPTTLVGLQGYWKQLNLNTTMEDIDGSETVTLNLSGGNLDEGVLEFRTKSGTLLDSSWNDSGYVIQNITPNQLNEVQIKSSKVLLEEFNLTLYTVDEGADIKSTGKSVTQTVSLDIAPTVVFLGTDGDDKLDSSDQTGALSYSGGAGDDIFIGGKGNDILNGDAGDDRLIGGLGHDKLSGGAGDDYLDGGTGFDYLSGGEGNDVLVYAPDNLSMNGGGGIDILLFNRESYTLDFDKISASAKFDQLEVIDMTDNGSQTITNLKTSDVIEVINDFDNLMDNKSLIIKGDSEDTVSLKGDDWVQAGSTSQDGTSYNIYTFTSEHGTHQLLIQTDIHTIL